MNSRCLSAGLFDSGFQARYPKSSEVYFAIIDAIDQGALERSEFEATVPGPSGYWRAAGRLKSIQQRLSAVTQVEPRPERAMSVVFIESDLWRGSSQDRRDSSSSCTRQVRATATSSW